MKEQTDSIQADRIKPNYEVDLIAGELTRLLRAVGVLNYDTQPNNAELIMCVAEFCKADRHKDKREAIIDVLVSRCPFVDACIRQCTPTDQDVCFGETADSLVPLFPTPKLTWQTFKEFIEGVELPEYDFKNTPTYFESGYNISRQDTIKAILDAIDKEVEKCQ